MTSTVDDAWYPGPNFRREDALALLDAALTRLDRLTPAEVRAPVDLWLRASHERVARLPVGHLLLGKPVVAVLQFAHALVEVTDAEDAAS